MKWVPSNIGLNKPDKTAFTFQPKKVKQTISTAVKKVLVLYAKLTDITVVQKTDAFANVIVH